MPTKDKEVDSGFDVQVVYPPTGIPAASNGNGNPVIVPNGGGSGYTVTPTVLAVQQPQYTQPSVVVITLGPKKAEDKKEKKSSSVFQRL
jgi:hypothetical protein